MADKRFLCIYGEEEKESLCSQLSGDRIRVAAFKGAHHFGGSFEAIANFIVGEIN
jgi:type IV secretory pathway VirJ component